MSRRHFICAAVVIALAFASGCSGNDEPATHQHDLEERLLSPCCWRQTLADHESPLATALRAEIHDRLARREPTTSIEADLVRRYGDKIRALPEGRDPRWIIGTAAGGGAVLGLLALVWFVRRRRAPREEAPVWSEAVFEGEYAERLDDELLAHD
jgi:cytochrome c-type biogenesis protein CcmH/NrfF